MEKSRLAQREEELTEWEKIEAARKAELDELLDKVNVLIAEIDVELKKEEQER